MLILLKGIVWGELMYKILKEDICGLSLFEDLKEEEIEVLVEKGSKEKLKTGEKLFSEKDLVNRIYIVLQGKVTLFRYSEVGQKRVIYILNRDEIINEVIFDGLPASINCEAFEDSIILSFKKEDLLKVMEKNFSFNKKVLNSMGRKIRRLYRQLKNVVPIKVDKKLAAKLWKLSKDYGVEIEEGTLIDLNISITYIADMLGSTRETVSRSMNKLQKEGLIEYRDKKIIVKSKEKLSMYFRGV